MDDIKTSFEGSLSFIERLEILERIEKDRKARRTLGQRFNVKGRKVGGSKVAPANPVPYGPRCKPEITPSPLRVELNVTRAQLQKVERKLHKSEDLRKHAEQKLFERQNRVNAMNRAVLDRMFNSLGRK